MIQAILTDIEGTTSSIRFVKDVLFPYARKRLPAFIETHADDPAVQHWLHEAAKEAGLVSATRRRYRSSHWLDRRRPQVDGAESAAGHDLGSRLREGEYRAHVYPEVPARLRAWRARASASTSIRRALSRRRSSFSASPTPAT